MLASIRGGVWADGGGEGDPTLWPTVEKVEGGDTAEAEEMWQRPGRRSDGGGGGGCQGGDAVGVGAERRLAWGEEEERAGWRQWDPTAMGRDPVAHGRI